MQTDDYKPSEEEQETIIQSTSDLLN